MPIYTQTNFKDAVFDPLKYPNIASDYTVQNVLNRAARGVLAEIDLHSTRRKVALSPNLFDDEQDYSFPSDGKSNGVIDVDPQLGRTRTFEWDMTTPEEFARLKGNGCPLIAVNEFDGIKKLQLAYTQNEDQLIIASLDDLTSGGGSWVSFGDGTNLTPDTDNFVKGSGSIRFDLTGAGGTTAGIQNQGMTAFDISDYVNLNRSVFAWSFVTSTTNVTNYILRLGSSSSAYYSITVTTAADGNAFRNGWNLLRFDFASKATTGSPDATVATYCALYMTKDPAKVSETAYRFDHVIAQAGRFFDLYYYSKFPWQSSAGTWKENSTASTDLLNADADEFDLFVLRAKIEAKRDLPSFHLDPDAPTDYANAVKAYRLKNPSQAKLITTTRYELTNG